MSLIKHGFEPIFDGDSKVLILGSFPSVKSREQSFYYGNPRNRFWKVLGDFFGEEVPKSNESKREFVLNHGIALWDIVTECEIEGSSDNTIKNYTVANLQNILDKTKISVIIINGGKAYEIYAKHYAQLKIRAVRLPSTSPANFKFDGKLWIDELRRAFE